MLWVGMSILIILMNKWNNDSKIIKPLETNRLTLDGITPNTKLTTDKCFPNADTMVTAAFDTQHQRDAIVKAYDLNICSHNKSTAYKNLKS